MTPDEFHAARKRLRLTQSAMGAHLGIAARTIRSLEAGTSPISVLVAREVRRMLDGDDLRAEVLALVKAATALRDQIARWHDGGPAAGPEESRALFEALDTALAAWEAAQ